MESPIKEISRHLKLIYNRRHLFILSSLFIMSLIIFWSYLLANTYKASSTLFIERNVIERLVKGIAISPTMNDRIWVLKDNMLSRSLVLNVLQKLGMDSQAGDPRELEQMIIDFQTDTELRVKNNSLVTVSYSSKDPVLARDYVNTLLDMYVERNVFEMREEASSATKFLEKQVSYFKGKVNEAQAAIIEFRKVNDIYIVEDEESIIREIKTYTMQIEDIDLKINELSATIGSIEKKLSGETGVSETIASLEGRRKELLLNYREDYPEIRRLEAELKTLRKHRNSRPAESEIMRATMGSLTPVFQELEQKVIEAKAEVHALDAKKNYLLNSMRNKEEGLKNVPEGMKKLAELIKERDSYKNVYQDLLVRLGQSTVSEQMEVEDKATTFRIVEPAILPTIPVSARRLVMVFAGIILGFLGGYGLVFALDYIDQSVKTLDSLKSFGLPVMAIIPDINTSDDLTARKKKDILLYGCAGVYILLIFTVVAFDVMGLNK